MQKREKLKSLKPYLILVSVLLLVSFLFGFFFPYYFTEQIKSMLTELETQVKNLNLTQLFFFILQNNLTTALIGASLGIAFGIFPIILILFNGYVIGYVSSKVVEVQGISSLWKLFPHGIFEIPAIIISFAIGIKLGTMILSIKNKKKYLFFISSLTLFILLFFILSILGGLILKSSSINPTNTEIIKYPIMLILLALVYLSYRYNPYISTQDRKEIKISFKKELEKVLLIFLKWVIPFLFIAAFIEASLIVLLK